MSKEDKVKTGTQPDTTITKPGTGTSSDADNSDLGAVRMILNGLDKVEKPSDAIPMNEKKDKK